MKPVIQTLPTPDTSPVLPLLGSSSLPSSMFPQHIKSAITSGLCYFARAAANRASKKHLASKMERHCLIYGNLKSVCWQDRALSDGAREHLTCVFLLAYVVCWQSPVSHVDSLLQSLFSSSPGVLVSVSTFKHLTPYEVSSHLRVEPLLQWTSPLFPNKGTF